MASITRIPDEVPERSVTSLGINWPATDSAGVPIAAGHVHVSDGSVVLTGIEQHARPVSEAVLVDALGWDEITAAMFVHTPDEQVGLLLVASAEESGATAVFLPSGLFHDEAGQPEFRAFIASELAQRVQTGRIAVVENNLNMLLGYAQEFAQYVNRDLPDVELVAVEEEPAVVFSVQEALAAEQQINYNETIVFDPNVPGSIFRNG